MSADVFLMMRGCVPVCERYFVTLCEVTHHLFSPVYRSCGDHVLCYVAQQWHSQAVLRKQGWGHRIQGVQPGDLQAVLGTVRGSCHRMWVHYAGTNAVFSSMIPVSWDVAKLSQLIPYFAIFLSSAFCFTHDPSSTGNLLDFSQFHLFLIDSASYVLVYRYHPSFSEKLPKLWPCAVQFTYHHMNVVLYVMLGIRCSLIIK